MPSFIVEPTITYTATNQIPIPNNGTNKLYYSPGASKKANNIIYSLIDLVKPFGSNFPPDLNNVSLRDSRLVLNIKMVNSSTNEHIDLNGSLKGTDIEGTAEGVDNVNNLLNTRYYIPFLKNGRYSLIYECNLSNYYTGASGSVIIGFTLTYDLYITENTEPLPKWNALTVLNRMLTIAEPIRQGETPRFKLDSTQREWLESIETPEFQFTQSTLRECLQGVGAYIHAEPRLILADNGDLLVHFDKYGGNDESEFAKHYNIYGAKSLSQNIESFATNIDSSVDNFVNSINYASSGTLVEPYVDGYKTVLAESSYVRITDSNMYIATQYPIRSIKSLKFGFDFTNDWEKIDADITPYVFESAEYQKLSSYDTQYPNSKAYAIYYTIGQKGIYGLNFKQEDLFQEWKNYAIINIINSAIGKSVNVSDYWKLNFQVEYVPIYPARVQQNKSIIDLQNIGKEWTKPYNQGQNMVETQYYGENLKGVIARLGNIDKTITYVINGFPSVLPNVGDLFNDDYYISSSAVELYSYYTKITLALSKDFNKYSEYVGVNSTKRMYEISEQQAFNSEVSFREFCVFADTGDNSIKDSENTLLDNTRKESYYNILKNLFIQDNAYINFKKISFVNAQGIDEDGNSLPKVALPVIRSSFGNACLLSFKYEDNYSAGNYSAYEQWKNDDNVNKSGFFTQTAPYTDVYGRIKSLKLDFISSAQIKEGRLPEDYLRYPPWNNDDWLGGTPVLSTGDLPIQVEKGNTEILSFNYQLEFISTRQDIIIGSGIAKNISLVKDANIDNRAKLYFFSNKLNKFETEVNISGAYLDEEFKPIYLSTDMFDTNTTIFKSYNPNLPQGTSYKSWALVAPFEVKDGNSTKTVYQLLIGCNMTIDSSTTNIFAGNGHSGLKMCIVAEKDLYK